MSTRANPSKPRANTESFALSFPKLNKLPQKISPSRHCERIIFFFHILAAAAAIRFSLYLGKEALITLVALMGVLANFFVLKQIDLLGFTVTCSDVFAIGDISASTCFKSVLAKKLNPCHRHFPWSLPFFASFLRSTCSIPLAITDTMHEQHFALFSPLPGSSWPPSPPSPSSSFPRPVFAYLCRRFQAHWNWLSLFSLLVSQALDTVLFSFLGLTASSPPWPQSSS